MHSGEKFKKPKILRKDGKMHSGEKFKKPKILRIFIFRSKKEYPNLQVVHPNVTRSSNEFSDFYKILTFLRVRYTMT